MLGASAVAATVGLLGPVSQLYALPADVAELVVIIGLAVGVDYAMFYSRRVMEERDRGRSVEAAVEIAAGTSGRAVLISGMTVMTAMGGLLFSGNPLFIGFGVGTMLFVAVAMLGSLTVLPALIAFLSRKNWLEKGRVPFITKRRHASKGESRVWAAILSRVLKRPLLSTVLAGGLLVALCIPALGLQFKNPGFDGYSRSQAIMQTHDRLQAAFPGGAVPARPSSRPMTSPPPRSAPRSSSCTTRRSPPGVSPSPRTSRSAPTRPSPSSRCRSPAAAPTPPPSVRSRRCAPRSSPPPWAGSRAPRSP